MDQLLEGYPEGGKNVARFTTEDLHKYLLGKDVPPKLLPKRIDLQDYTSHIDSMYENKTQIGKNPNPKNVRKDMPVFGERGSSSFFDPETQTVQFSPIIHGTETSVGREVDDLIRQNKRPLVELHTHPEDTTFSPNDLSILMKKSGDGRTLKALVVLCPSIQVLALATSETPLLDQDTVDKILLQYKMDDWKEPETEDYKDQQEKKAVIYSRRSRANRRLGELLTTKKITLEQYMEKVHQFDSRTDNLVGAITTAQLDTAKQETNQWLLNFAYTNNIKFYASTNRKDFVEFTA